MNATTSFKEIKVWQKAHQFVVNVYKLTRRFPDFEKYGLSSQFQRAAVSIPANFAEGYKPLSTKDKFNFLNIAQGSLEECRYYVLLSKDLEYISIEAFEYMNNSIEEVSKVLNAYCKGMKENNFSGQL